MRQACRSLALLGLVVAVLAGCLGEPIPKRVVAGTTFVLPFQSALFGVNPGQNQGTLLKTDVQRGNLRLALCPTNSIQCTSPLPLTIKYMNRIFPDRGSRLGLDGAVEARPAGGGETLRQEERIVGETVVFVDVPIETQAGSYMLASFFDPPGPMEEGSAVLVEPIEIVAGSIAAFTDLSRLVDLGGADGSPSLQGFFPDPQLSLVLIDTATRDDRPAAGTLVVQHPASVTIPAGFETGVLGQASLVRVSKLPNVPGQNPRVSVTFVDPERRIGGLRLVLRSSDPNTPLPQLATSQFQILSPQALYRDDGTALPLTTVASQPGNSFTISSID